MSPADVIAFLAAVPILVLLYAFVAYCVYHLWRLR